MAFAPAGLITLTTDFGTREPFVGIMRGRIFGRCPAARVIDLTHGIPAGRADLAGFWLAQAWQEYPSGTVHLAVVDPGVGTARAVLLAEVAGQLLLAPDNGLLAEALRGTSGVCWRGMSEQLPVRLRLGPLSRTFHGRDLFAPLAAELACGALPPGDFGPAVAPSDPAPLPRPSRDERGILGQVLVTDGFGNLFTNIGADQVAACRQPFVEIAGRLLEVRPTYGTAPAGSLLALVNAFGMLEVARNGGSAAAELGVAEGTPVCLHDGVPA